MERAIIFDLDGTLVADSAFYRAVYSGSLTSLVQEMRGEDGLKTLAFCRQTYNGKGELALFALNIPYTSWVEQLVKAPLDLITPQPQMVESIRTLSWKKVIYTGSPRLMAIRTLKQLGFKVGDFDLIIGWDDTDMFPVKWTCAISAFELILLKIGCQPPNCWSVGDTWETDLRPAQLIGAKTAKIGSMKNETATACFPRINDFLSYLKGGSDD